MQGTVLKLIEQTNFDKSLLVGYYGGGNFGDELLLEVILNLLKGKDARGIAIYYLNPDWYADYHKDFGYKVVGGSSLWAPIRQFLTSKNIVVGGGGLWGLDMNRKVLFMSLALLMARFGLRKRVYLVGVGYYNSTNTVGKFAAWCAARAASAIIARDQETFDNFSKFCKNVWLDHDLSAYVRLADSALYSPEVKTVQNALDVSDQEKALFITIRKFKGQSNVHYKEVVKGVVASNTGKRIILVIFEPRHINLEDYDFISNLMKNNSNVTAWDFRANPVGLWLYLRKVHNSLIMITPHYHGLAAALDAKIPFLPIVYDNKSLQLLQNNGVDAYYTIEQLTHDIVQQFIDEEYAR
jgi:polysaccharide pyruvyl transferase WcaK-like protein